MSGPKRNLPPSRGFGLVEIAVTLGIVSFVVLSLFGLMAVGLNADKESKDDTMVAALAKTVISQIRAAPFDSLAHQVLYFDHDGRPADAGGAYYRCEIQVLAPGLPKPGLAEHAKRIRLEFSYPFNASASTHAPEQIFETTLARD